MEEKKPGKTRRGNNEGSIWPEKDAKGKILRWRAAVTVGYKEDGQPIRKTLSGKTRQAVKDKLTAYLEEKDKGLKRSGKEGLPCLLGMSVICMPSSGKRCSRR